MLPLSPETFLDSNLIERMSPADFTFARNQLREIYSKEMSKLSVDLQRKIRVQSNLQLQHKEVQEYLRKEEVLLNHKLDNAQQKRVLEQQKRSQIRHIKELKWMERKERAESRQQKEILQSWMRQREMSRDLQQYRQKKNLKSKSIQKSRIPSPPPTVNQHYAMEQNIERLPSIRKLKIQKTLPQKSRQRTLKLDSFIREHQQKKNKIIQERQQSMLKNYLQRVQSIQRRRQQKKSKSQWKKPIPAEQKMARPRERDVRERDVDRPSVWSVKEDRSQQNQRKKQRKQEQQFIERSNLLESIRKQALKSSIVKQIKTKVNEFKTMAHR